MSTSWNNQPGKYHEKWSENDTILAFFCEKWGANNLISSYNIDSAIEDIANRYIGTSDTSLKMSMSNIRYIMSNGADGLSCYSVIQKEVYDKYNSYSKEDYKNVCLEIMGGINTEEVYKTFNKMLTQNIAIGLANKVVKTAEKNRQELNKINRKQQIEVAAISLGKNPKKLISIEEYRKRHPEFTK
jgi:hypothetical protein